MKKTTIKEIITPQEHHEKLNACINCVYELTCENILPFPINLDECCDKYKKTEFKYKSDSYGKC